MASPGKPPVKRPHEAGVYRPPALMKGVPRDIGESITDRNRDLFTAQNENSPIEMSMKRRIASKMWR